MLTVHFPIAGLPHFALDAPFQRAFDSLASMVYPPSRFLWDGGAPWQSPLDYLNRQIFQAGLLGRKDPGKVIVIQSDQGASDHERFKNLDLDPEEWETVYTSPTWLLHEVGWKSMLLPTIHWISGDMFLEVYRKKRRNSW